MCTCWGAPRSLKPQPIRSRIDFHMLRWPIFGLSTQGLKHESLFKLTIFFHQRQTLSATSPGTICMPLG